MLGPKIFREPISAPDIRQLAEEEFEDMIKFVVDLERKLICAGGGMHSDEEQLLLEDGSRQEHLWGANYYPGNNANKKIDYVSMINLRPASGNKAQEIQSEVIRQKVQEIALHFFGSKD